MDSLTTVSLESNTRVKLVNRIFKTNDSAWFRIHSDFPMFDAL